MTIDKLITLKTREINLNPDLIQLWDKIVNLPDVKENTVGKIISPAVANSYIGNFYGLLGNELNLPEDAFYPTLLVNNLRNPVDYSGSEIIYIISPDVFEKYHTLIKEKISLEESLQ